ncbi:MAG TPA: DUF3606 domain-containing protein [Pedobacter sp.]|nr:DUF3606 domain-containing protein [Pedobacter sp.]
MSDDKTRKDGRDDAKIDVNDASELEYAAKLFKVTPDRVREAVEAVGESREKVNQFLAGK